MIKIDVLDHGFVRLVSYMQPVPEMGVGELSNGEIFGYIKSNHNWTGDLEVIRNARVSYNVQWRTGVDKKKDEKLIGYLLKNRHTSPSEAMVFTFEVKAPIFILRQWQRHRTWSYNEVSARYTELSEEFYTPEIEQITTQSTDNKQMRTIEEHPHSFTWRQDFEAFNKKAFVLYKQALNDGVPRELARTVLPLATYSHMFATVDLHNLFHFLKLRLHEHAQYEIRVYAEALLKLIEPIVPISLKFFKEHNL